MPTRLATAGRKAHEEDLKNFIDIASHELRHPVTIIKGYAQTLHELERQMDESTRTEVLQAIEKGADRLNSLVMELLDVSRIERGRFGLEKELVELKPLIENAVAEVSGRYRNNEFNLEIRGGTGQTLDRRREDKETTGDTSGQRRQFFADWFRH